MKIESPAKKTRSQKSSETRKARTDVHFISLPVPVDLMPQIDDRLYEERFDSRNATIIELLRRGLRASPPARLRLKKA